MANKNQFGKNNFSYKHGLSESATYYSWKSMIARCNNPNATGYKNYGGRGIKVCKRWLKFENFLKDMGKRPKNKTLDRINNNGNYKPANCKWSDNTEQNRKKRSIINITFNGKTKIMADWAKLYGIKQGTLRSRINNGWGIRRALETPVRGNYE